MWLRTCLLVLFSTLCGCEERPILHWRTGRRTAGAQEDWHKEDWTHQEVVLEVSDLRWGPLLNSVQILITLGSTPTHELQKEINSVLVQFGGQVINYIPDHSLLAIGERGVVNAVKSVHGVVWAGQFHPRYKIAPEWDSILKLAAGDEKSLTELLNGKKLNGGKGLEALTGDKGLSEDFFGELEVDTSGSEPRFVIEVHFPQILGMRGKNVYEPGQAALYDWVGEVQHTLGKDVMMMAQEHGLLEVVCPPRLLRACLELLADQPSVHWLQPKPKSRLHNWRAGGIIQSGQAPVSEDGEEDPGTHPIWSAGIRGEGQIVGCGDSGIDVDSCFFHDPAVSFKDGIQISSQVGKKQYFESESHRKVHYYQGTADLIDINGHGSHVVGSILGKPFFNTDPRATGNRGMAPDARVAFMDLGGDDSRSIYTPRELSRFYYPNTYERGARIHSDSWGSDSPVYDILSAEVDKFTWEHQEFLPIFAAGNYGELSQEFLTTVTSPAVAKNCLAVGATLTADQVLRATREEGVATYEIEVETVVDGGAKETRRLKILESWFGGSWSKLIQSSAKNGIQVIGANPKLGCTPLTQAMGSIVLMERGDCTFVTKLRNAENRGAAGVIITNNIHQGYFEMAANISTFGLTIPMGAVPISIGRELWEMVDSKQSVVVRVLGKAESRHSFDNIADFSSAGPTPDRRIKPDIVAPGRIKSAWSDGQFTSEQGQCKMLTMSGTSMATPVVAGAAALVRQYFTDGYYPSGERNDEHEFVPSAALIKASLLGGAYSMDGFTEAGLPLEPAPSFRQGFGRVLLEQSIPVRNSKRWKSGWRMQVVDSAELNTGETHNYCVRALGGPLKVTLVWTDYPASPTVQKALVNDLDLVVRSAGLRGRFLLGNGVEDRVNNVEQVSVEDMPEGNIAITVKAHQVMASHGAQPYALVVHGNFNGILQSPQNPVGTPTTASNESCIITLAVIQSGPKGATGDNSPTFEFTTQSEVDPLGGYECQLTDMEGGTSWGPLHDWKDCKSPVKHDELPDKAYKFSVRPKGEDVIASRSFQVDTEPPNLLILGEPIPERSTQEDVEFQFAALDSTAVAFECRFRYDGPNPDWFHTRDIQNRPVRLGSWFPCSSPQALHGIPYGNWVLEIKGKDDAGNESQEPATHKWMTYFEPDTVYVRTISRPVDIISSLSFSFQVQAILGMESSPPILQDVPLECSLEIQVEQRLLETVWQDCGSNVTYRDVDDGTYQFQVRTVDPRGHGDDSVSQMQIVVDRTPPVVDIIQYPNEYHGAQTVRIKFEATEEVVGYKCSVVQKGQPFKFQKCLAEDDGSVQYTLEDGRYKFQVSAEDHAGNVGKSDEIEFMVDSVPPFVAVKPPKPGNQKHVRLEFEIMENGGSGVIPSNVSCLLRNEGKEVSPEWVPGCTSPQKYELEEGRYIFNVRAIDRAGLHNDLKDYIITVDMTPPTSEITGAPSDQPQPPLVAFKFVGQDKPERIASLVAYHQCRVTTFTPAAPTGPRNRQNGDFGGSKDTVLNISETAQSRLLSTPEEDSFIQIRDGATAELGKWVICESPVVLTKMATGFYKFETRAIDEAGNVGKSTSPITFEVDATIPVPGEDSSGGKRSLAQWVWVMVAAIAGVGMLTIIGIIVVCRMRSRSRRRQHAHGQNRRPRYRASGPTNYRRSGSTGMPLSAGSQDISSVGSDDPMMSLAIRASIQQRELDGEERQKQIEGEENARIQAAVQASMESYQIHQAVQNSYQDAQDHWCQSLCTQPSAPPQTTGDFTSTSPWAFNDESNNRP